MNDLTLKSYVSNFKHYVQSLEMDEKIKQAITSDNFINKNPDYYLYYPSLFNTAFDIEASSELAIAGYLYYQSTLFLDGLIDNDAKEKIPLIIITQEESIKLLTHLFGLKSEFWFYWKKRRYEYTKAVKIEKSLSGKEKVNFDDYAQLAGFKASFGKSAIDSNYVLSGSKNAAIHTALTLSHDYFSVALQLSDDIQDFQEDYKDKQFNWAYYTMSHENDMSQDIAILNKLLYINGHAKELYLTAIEYLDKAMAEVKNINVPSWLNLLHTTKKSVQNSIFEIDNYLYILNAEINIASDKTEKNSLPESLASSLGFILKNQQENGSWKEYINQGGISSVWATAYIVSHLSEIDTKNAHEAQVENGLAFLKKAKKGKLWGYNQTWISDADSTTFALLSSALNDKKKDNVSFDEWTTFQKADGSFSTYKDEDSLLHHLNDKNIKDVSGWIATHQCVSAAAFYFLTNTKHNNNALEKLSRYFKNSEYSSIQSYWWTSPLYSLYFLAKAYNNLNNNDEVQKIIREIKKYRNKDGSFSDNYGVNMFYTGLALEVLLLDFTTNQEEIELTKNYLLLHQYSDGSWENSHALQVPNSSDIVPSNEKYPISKSGMNVRAKEFNRLFTTITVLKSLTVYGKTRINP